MKALIVKNLTKVYGDNLVVLDNVSFSLNKGDFLGLLGPNGSGKSTLLGILTTLLKKTSGFISVFDFNIDSHAKQIKALLGYVPQEYNFSISEPVWQIIINQAGYHGLKKSYINDFAEFYLKKLNLWEKRTNIAGLLSGGMKRRLMLIRALITKPQLLILDEPTVGIDIENRVIVWEILREINRNGTTLIIASHVSEEINALCSEILEFNTGKIIFRANEINKASCEV